MKSNRYILSVTGSDSTGGAGIQADINTITSLGYSALTAITSITMQTDQGIHYFHDLPTQLITDQIRSSMASHHPHTAKIGLVRNADTIRAIRNEIISCRNIVLDPGFISSYGERIADNDSISAIMTWLVPEATLLLLRCQEAEIILGMNIETDDDMLTAAKRLHGMGAQWVMLRGGHHIENRLTALLYSDDFHRFFSSYNIDGWQKHGVGGMLSTAVAAKLEEGNDMLTAIKLAHDFIHSQVIHEVSDERTVTPRPNDIYNRFLSLITDHYSEAHDVNYYADTLSITPRYLSQITSKVIGKSPKAIISEYLIHEAQTLLTTSSLSAQEISHKLGFTSQAQFCNFFKKQTGNSPLEYRSL